jgi:hypothetical protein
MAQAIGSAAQIAIIEETVWGTTPATPQMKVLSAALYGENLVGEAGELVSNSINPNRGVADTRNGQIKVAGSIPFELPVEGLGTVLKGVMGDVDTTGTGPYTHVFKRGTTLPSFTIEKGFTDIGQYFIYKGCKFGSLSLNVAPDGLAQGSIDVMGKNVTVAQTPLDATPTTFTHKAYANFEGALLEGGSAAKLLNLNFNITNGLYDARIVGSRESANIGAGKSEITGEISVMFEDLTYFNKWLNETETSIKLTYTNGTSSCEFNFPRVKYTGAGSPAIESQEGVILNLKFRALVDVAEASDVVITLINDEATV